MFERKALLVQTLIGLVLMALVVCSSASQMKPTRVPIVRPSSRMATRSGDHRVSPEAVSARLAGLLAEPGAAAILTAFSKAGEETRIIGGAVRNALLGADFADLDLATTALPQRTMALAEAEGWKAIPTGSTMAPSRLSSRASPMR